MFKIGFVSSQAEPSHLLNRQTINVHIFKCSINMSLHGNEFRYVSTFVYDYSGQSPF